MADVQIAIIDQENTQIALAAPSETSVNIAVPGIQGAPGPGVPTGGTANQVLFKQSGTNYDTAWSTVTSAMIGDLQIADADVSTTAAIAGTKIAPNFGSQTVQTTGVFSHALGTAAAPTVTFTGDPNTGLYSPGADQLAISTGGTGRVFVDSSGNVGVGLASPATAFGKAGSIDANGILVARGAVAANQTNAGVLQYNANETCIRSFGATAGTGLIVFNTGGGGGSADSEKVRITSGGNVGIGTSAPQTPLDVVADASGYGIVLRGRSADNLGQLRFASNNYASIYSELVSTSSALAINVNAAERLRITSDGKVGIGTSSPTELLDIDGDGDSYLRWERDGSAGSYSGVTSGGVLRIGPYFGATNRELALFTDNSNNSWITTGTAESLVFGINKTERLRITSDGNVGIGTSSPGAPYLLDVAGSAKFSGGNGYVSFGDNGYIRTDAANELRFQGGTSGISFWKSGMSSESARIDNSGRLLVGTSSTSKVTSVLVQGNSDGSTNEAALRLNRGQATPADGATLGVIIFGDSAHSDSGYIFAARDAGTWSASSKPTRLVISTTADGASSPTERMRISSDGLLTVYSSNGNGTNLTSSFGSGTSENILSGYYGATSTTSNGTASFAVRTNGNVLNANNSYAGISDIKLKENVVDAASQWDDIKALQVRKYNFKEGQTHTQIGLVAQEVELVSPGLVSESPDRDKEGNDLGTVTKSVNYSVLYMKAVKALQEAMERIETLEAKVAALESA